MAVQEVAADFFIRVFTQNSTTNKKNKLDHLILDIRPLKDFKVKHVMQSYAVRLSASGEALLDYSKNSYNIRWSEDCWWNKNVLVYGPANLPLDHPIIAFLSKGGHAKSISVYRSGFEVLNKTYPFLCCQAVTAGAKKWYPAEILPGLLYLSDLEMAKDSERLDELKIRRVITIHNNPNDVELQSKYQHLKFQLPDLETENIAQFFQPTYEFIEQARAARQGVLVHCGAGVSRSAALVIAYLMRRLRWPAERALAHAVERRPVVATNAGFWDQLCKLEEELGIKERQLVADPAAASGAAAATAGPDAAMVDAAAERIAVRVLPKPGSAAAAAQALPAPAGEKAGKREERDRAEGRDRDGKHRDREEDRDRGREKDERRDRDRDREKDRGEGRGEKESRRDRGDRGDDRKRDRDRTDGHEKEDRKRSRGSERDDRDRDRDRDRDAPARPRGVKEEVERGTPPEEPGGAEEPPPGCVVLEVLKEGKVVKMLELGLSKPGHTCLVGRIASCNLMLEHASISRHHAQISLDASGRPTVMDLGSAHGTSLDGTWLRAKTPRQLKVGSVLRFGGSTRQYKVAQAVVPAKPVLNNAESP